jgi:uncharacterized protein (TIGR03084 family)
MSLRELLEDLAAEQAALDEIVSRLTDEQWVATTPSPGWTVADQIAHLTYFDGTAALAITDPDRFVEVRDALYGSAASGGAGADDLTLGAYRSLPPAEELASWRGNRERLQEAGATLADGDRVIWYGPSMSAKSFLTARLMECWAHGQDVADAVGAERPAGDRLRHIAQLGFITRGWSYVNRGEEPPAGTVRLELVSPAGETWTWGPEDADDVVRGPAEDFCLVVTQRRHVDDTRLVCGDLGRHWLLRAQAFAGGPTDGPAPGRS